MKDFYTEYLNDNNNRSKLERKLDEVNHTMELIRTILPIVLLIMQTIIIIKLFQ